LSIPKDIRPIAYLCLGYVDEFAEIPDLERAGWLPRLELSQVICYEQWGKISATFKKDDTVSDTRLTKSAEA
jgi:hypothetical protein